MRFTTIATLALTAVIAVPAYAAPVPRNSARGLPLSTREAFIAHAEHAARRYNELAARGLGAYALETAGGVALDVMFPEVGLAGLAVKEGAKLLLREEGTDILARSFGGKSARSFERHELDRRKLDVALGVARRHVGLAARAFADDFAEGKPLSLKREEVAEVFARALTLDESYQMATTPNQSDSSIWLQLAEAFLRRRDRELLARDAGLSLDELD
ncbi:hypothetical protein BC835DRAFT_1412821 [Cytidiella melzeri]|nr:hypothetical protein BC835DRAFT_1412821 [Cytidiella melzeri]